MDVAHPSGCSSTASVAPPALLGSLSDEAVSGRVHESSVVDDGCLYTESQVIYQWVDEEGDQCCVPMPL